MIVQDVYTDYSNEEIFLIKERLLSYKTVIGFIHNCFTNIESIPETEDFQKDNLIRICPHFYIENQRYKDEEMNFIEILDVYDEWLNSLSEAIVTNKNSLKKNKALLKHLEESYNMCLTLDKHIVAFFKSA